MKTYPRFNDSLAVLAMRSLMTVLEFAFPRFPSHFSFQDSNAVTGARSESPTSEWSRQFISIFVFAVLMILPTLGAAAEFIFWTEPTTHPPSLRRATQSGTEATIVQNSSQFVGAGVFDVAVDPVNNFVFWSDGTGTNSRIFRSTMSGTNAVTVLSYPDVSSPRGIALNMSTQQIYWVDAGTQSIRRSSYSGTNRTIIQNSQVGPNPFDIEVDPAGNKIFWSDRGSVGGPGRVMRATLSGTDATDVFGGSSGIDVLGIALDPVGGRFFRIEKFLSTNVTRIIRANYSGTDAVIVQDTDVFSAIDIEFNTRTNQMFWTESTPRIMRATISGTEAVVVQDTFVTSPFGLAVTVDETPVADLIAHWPFDDGLDPTAEVINGNHGDLMGGASFVAGGVPIDGNVSAVDFGGGTTDYVEVTDDATLDLSGSITVAAWINLRSLGATIVAKEEAAFPAKVNYFLAVGASNKPVFAVTFFDSPNANSSFPKMVNLGLGNCNFNDCFSQGASDFVTAAKPFGTWRHIAGVYDLTTKAVRIYVDGKLDGETIFDPFGTISGTIRTNNDPVWIGRRIPSGFSGPGPSVDGQIDDVRIYNRPLNDQEIRQLAQPGLVAHWPFDDGTDPTLDILGGNDGILRDGTPPQFLGGVGIAPIPGNIDALNITNTTGVIPPQSYVEVAADPALDQTGSFTIAAWFNINDYSHSSGHPIISKSGPGQSDARTNYNIQLSNAQGSTTCATCSPDDWIVVASVTVSEPSGTVTAVNDCEFFALGCGWVRSPQPTPSLNGTGTINPTVNPGWHHVALVFDLEDDGSTMQIFLDGTLDAEQKFQSAGGPVTPQAFPLNNVWIGARPDFGFGGPGANMKVDDLRIYNRALGDAEIASLAGRFFFRKIADTDTVIPGQVSATFTGFGDVAIDGPDVAFFGNAPNPRFKGIFLESGGDLANVVNGDTIIPGGTGEGITFFPSLIPSLRDGLLGFHGFGLAPRQGIYISNFGGSVNAVADTNTVVPNESPNLFLGFGVAPVIDGGAVYFRARPGAVHSGVYTTIPGGTLDVVVDRNTAIPDGILGTTFGFISTFSVDNGNVVFRGTDEATQDGVYTVIGGGLRKVADKNTPVFGGTGNFGQFGGVAIEGNQVVFTNNGPSGVYLFDGVTGIPQRVIADTNTPIPDGVGNFTSFGAPSMDGGNVAFFGFGASGQRGIYIDIVGTLKKVIDLNDSLDNKTISDLSFLNRRVSLSGNSIAFHVRFTDGSESIFVASPDFEDIDVDAPIVTAPPHVTASATGALTSVVIGEAAATDDVGVVSLTNDAPEGGFPVGSTIVTWTATDAAGNVGEATQRITVVDTTPPVLTVPGDIAVEAEDALGTPATNTAIVAFLGAAFANDAVYGPVGVTNNAPQVFQLGETFAVTFTATDAAGNVAMATANVTVVDTTPPETSITFAEDKPGAVVTDGETTQLTSIHFSFEGSDAVGVFEFLCNLDGEGPSPCTSPQNYSGLTDGSHTFQVRANDSAGNLDPTPASFGWTIDTTPPVMIQIDDLTAEATSPDGAVVDFGLPDTIDAIDPSPTVVAEPPSGSTFPLGTTAVTVTATDVMGNQSQITFTVTVVDATAPELIALPGDIIALSQSTSSAVSYSLPTAIDIVDLSPTVLCSPLPGSTFSLGVTTVDCTGADASGNINIVSFTVTLLLDIDSDGVEDVADPCPGDPTNTCDPNGSAAEFIGPSGGNVATQDGDVAITIPPGALDGNTVISVTDTGSNFELTSNLGQAVGVFGVTILPEGTTFNAPITINFSWDDVDNDGKVDGTNIKEDNLRISKDNVALTDKCRNEVGPGLPICDTNANTFSFQVASLSQFDLIGPLDTDNDEVWDNFDGQVDGCNTTPGPAERQGCPVGVANVVDLHVVDQAKIGECSDGSGSCKLPVEGASVKVFDRNRLDGLVITVEGEDVTLTKIPDGIFYDDIFESSVANNSDTGALAARVGCLTDSEGSCTAGVETTDDFLVIVKIIVKTANGNRTVYTGSHMSPMDFEDTDESGLVDTASKNFQILKVIRKNGDIQLGRGSKKVLTGSFLEIVYPEYAVWEEGVTDYIYPFIFTSDSSWEVDVCNEVPVGYQIVGVYDVDGNLVTTDTCVQTFVADQIKVLAFEVVDLQSPPPHVKTWFNVRGPHGKRYTIAHEVRGHRKGKDKPMPEQANKKK